MAIMIDRETLDLMSDEWKDEQMVCSFCDWEVSPIGDSDIYCCGGCDSYKGIMTVREWESYTGEVWES
jgi:hypothetical protein